MPSFFSQPYGVVSIAGLYAIRAFSCIRWLPLPLYMRSVHWQWNFRGLFSNTQMSIRSQRYLALSMQPAKWGDLVNTTNRRMKDPPRLCSMLVRSSSAGFSRHFGPVYYSRFSDPGSSTTSRARYSDGAPCLRTPRLKRMDVESMTVYRTCSVGAWPVAEIDGVQISPLTKGLDCKDPTTGMILQSSARNKTSPRK